MVRVNKSFSSPLLLCLLFLLPPSIGRAELAFGPGPESAASGLDAIVAVVNDDVITRRELEAAAAFIERQLQQKKVQVPSRTVLESQTLERLILMQLQMRAAERNGITVDDATLNAAIENLAKRNNMSLSQLQQSVEKDGQSFAKFRENVRQEIMGARLRQKMVDSQIQISEQDVESLRTQLAGQGGDGAAGGGEREYHLAQILIALPEGASPQQIETAKRRGQEILAQLRKGADFRQLAVSVSADRQALEGGDLGWRRADQLPTLFAEVVPKLQAGQVSDLIRSPSGFHIVKVVEIKGGGDNGESHSGARNQTQALVTQTHARHILLRVSPQRSDDDARQQLEQLRQRIQKGEDFAALARANSDDKVSGARGGDLGWVSPGMLVPQFEQEMDKLQPNAISAPFKSPFGWHIVQVLERRQGQATPQDDRTRLGEALFRRRSDEEWDLWLRRLRDEAYVEIRLPSAAEKPTAASPSTP